MVVVRDITFAAICEQTLLPFHGRCHIAYTPRDGVILGLSKLARVTKCLACKLQQQAAFAQKLMQAVQSEVGPLGVAVVVQANHLRGAQQPTPAITSAASGIFHDSTTGMFLEFLTLLQLSGNAAVVSALRGLSHESSRDGVAAAAAAAAASGEQQTSPSWPPEALAQLMKCNLGSTGVSSTDMAAAVIELLEGVGEDPGRPVRKLWHFLPLHSCIKSCHICEPLSSSGQNAVLALESPPMAVLLCRDCKVARSGMWNGSSLPLQDTT